MVIFFNLSPTLSHLHPLQVDNSQLVVDEDDNGKFRLERVKTPRITIEHIVHMALLTDVFAKLYNKIIYLSFY